MAKRKLNLKLALVSRTAIAFDGEGGGKIKFQFDTTQTATVAELLLAGESLIDATLVFDDAGGDSDDAA